MLGFPVTESGADSSTPPLPTLSYGEEKPVPYASRPRRNLRYPDPTSTSFQLRFTPQPSKTYRDIPNELWYLAFEFLVPSDITRPTHHILVQVKGVCRLWREIARRLIWEARKSLVASPRLFDSPPDDFPRHFPREIQLWLEERLAHAGCKQDTQCESTSGATSELRLVAFHLDNRYHPDQNLAKFFVSALSMCVHADITIDHFSSFSTPFPSFDAHGNRSLPAIPLRQFSFSSVDLGIRDTLPQQFNFPWYSLRRELPWSQLTDITLDCVLSYDDALAVLSATENLGRAELGRLSSPGLSERGSSATINVISTLHTLKINTCIDLRPLLSRLHLPALEDLQLAVYLDSISNAPTNHILNPILNVPWYYLKRLSLQSALTNRRCDLNGILRHCQRLEQLRWEGDRSEFNHLPFGALRQLQELIFTSDPAGHRHVFDNIRLFPDITKLSLSHYHALLVGDANLPNLLHLTISGPITLVLLFQILRSRTQRLLSGDFHLSTMTQFCPPSVRCEVLQILKLTLVDSSFFPWEKLHAPQLKTLEMNLRDGPGVQSSVRREMEGFRSVHIDTIISISSK
ncbi:hypothetical protein M413DRAFT_193013 [Hebeloma cylindrosporum]|uniref:F-box domain-containing protein n=1 Tax=Hebeloma cylindrosporum TaxID=76867 RepID=A0A0C2YET9_HEBCY|nr:hypothetical protein M413DRAFT_193013 [Hebeloma cylindrosporum h7]